jgi:hypothetical protein
MPLTAAAVSKPFHLLRIGAKIAVAAAADPAATRITFSLFPIFALITPPRNFALSGAESRLSPVGRCVGAIRTGVKQQL